jgi:glutathione S-transferase
MASEIYPMVEITDYPRRFVSEGDEANALRLKAGERVRERLLIIEKNVAGPWLLASGFSAADIYAAMFTRWRDTSGEDWLEAGHLPRLSALAKALCERPKIAPVSARHFGDK